MNSVEWKGRERRCSGLYVYTFRVNLDELLFEVYRVRERTPTSWVFVNLFDHHEGGDDYFSSRKAAFYGLVRYLLARRWDTSLRSYSWVPSLNDHEIAAEIIARGPTIPINRL